MNTDELIAALTKPLVEPYRTPKKAPKHFDKKLENACTSIHRNVFLDQGFQAWFAYTQVERRVQMAVEQLPHATAESVARRICSIKPHPSVEILFKHMFYESFRAKDRRAQLQRSNYSPPGSADVVQPQDSDEPPPISNHRQGSTSPGGAPSVQMQDPGDSQPTDNHSRRSNAEYQLPPIADVHPNNSSLPPLAANASPGIRLPLLTDNIHPVIGQPNSPGHSQDVSEVGTATEIPVGQRIWALPDAKNMASLFPPGTRKSIVMKGLEAAIRAVFGDTNSQCYLEIDIYRHKIPALAAQLFGVYLEATSEGFSMILESGLFVLCKTVTLSGANPQAVENVLGKKAFEFIRADPLYVEELNKGEPITNLISLHIKGNGEDPSCLKVESTAHTISLIAEQLYPTFRQGGISQ
ncbi:hypothetical protein F5883DRAFT_716087 [Diaporthe sp. PMI_573]|nr:hypothetical protein F5883DRAFT_716087 [Diaporthaceae sp. PMI_573]